MSYTDQTINHLSLSHTHKHCGLALLLVISVILGSGLPLLVPRTPGHCRPCPFGPLDRRQPGHPCSTSSTCCHLRDLTVNFLFLSIQDCCQSGSFKKETLKKQQSMCLLASLPPNVSFCRSCFLYGSLTSSSCSAAQLSHPALLRCWRSWEKNVLLLFLLLLCSPQHWLTQCRLLEHQ